MTFTSEERREVAARLRGEEIARNSEEAYVVLLSCIGVRPQLPAVRTYKDAMARMADLIDPTCHIVLRQSDSDFTDEPHYMCSRCGKEAVYVYERNDYTLDGIVSHARYCSYCGARVVSGDDAS